MFSWTSQKMLQPLRTKPHPHHLLWMINHTLRMINKSSMHQLCSLSLTDPQRSFVWWNQIFIQHSSRGQVSQFDEMVYKMHICWISSTIKASQPDGWRSFEGVQGHDYCEKWVLKGWSAWEEQTMAAKTLPSNLCCWDCSWNMIS